MSRSARLLNLMQALRRRRTAVTAAELAGELGVSERTIYRDIATLAAEGAPIEGAAGLGYVMRPGVFLPPMSFDEDELEALVLGLRWVEQRTDPALARGAQNALAKIAAVLPEGGRERAESAGVLVGPAPEPPPQTVSLAVLREAIRRQRKLAIGYWDGAGQRTERTIWPIALAFPEGVRLLAGWCELRQDFRNFRVDRIASAEATGERYPGSRQALIKAWMAQVS